MLRHKEIDTQLTLPANPSLGSPKNTLIVEITPDQVESTEVRAVFAIWQQHKGSRAMPSRDEVLPRPLGKLLRTISLVRVMPETNDYELRIVGDAHVQAYGTNSQGMTLSDITTASPEFVAALKYSYDLVCARRAPIGYRGIMGRDLSHARFDWFETLYLPLGVDGDVEFILNASVYQPRNGKWPD